MTSASRPHRACRGPRLAAALACLTIATAGCTVHEHTVGLGPNGIGERSERQFYYLFGLFRLNEVDTERMTDDFTSYRIRTETAFTDLLLAPLLLPFSVTSRTVTVSR